MKTAFLLDFCIEYPYGYSTRNDRIKLKVGTGNTGSFFCGGWMHWETPAALHRARKCLPALYLWFRRNPHLCSISASYPPTQHMAGWTGSKQGGGQKTLLYIWTWAIMEHMRPVQSFCPQVHPRAAGEWTAQQEVIKQHRKAGTLQNGVMMLVGSSAGASQWGKVYGRTLMGAWWSLGTD